MSDKENTEPTGEEKLGAYLKRARLAADIDLAEFAREIRVTPEMLEHLEEGHYDKLPVGAYVRGYLNTISSRLGLDRNRILEWYNSEVGREIRNNNIIQDLGIDTHRTNSSGGNGPNKLVLFIVGLLAILFILVLKYRDAGAADYVIQDSTSQEQYAEDSSEEESVIDSSLVDSLETDFVVKDSVPADTVLPQKEKAEVKVETLLKFECLKDSTWIRVRKAGQLPWDRFLRAKDNKPRIVSHNDTMMVNVGSPEKTRMYIDGKRMSIPSGRFYILNGKIIERD